MKGEGKGYISYLINPWLAGQTICGIQTVSLNFDPYNAMPQNFRRSDPQVAQSEILGDPRVK